MNRRKTFFLIIAGILLLTFRFSVPHSDYVIKGKLTEAFAISEFVEKPLIILFSINNCHDCVELKTKTLSEDKTADFLRERFIVVDINPVPYYKARYPLNQQDAQEYSYAVLYRNYGVKRTPTLMFFDRNGEYVNRTTGFYESDFLLEIIEQMSPLYKDKVGQAIKPIPDEDTANMMMQTLPNLKVLGFEEFKQAHETLPELDYYIVTQVSFKTVKSFLDETGSNLKNIFVFEGVLEKNEVTLEEEKKEQTIQEEPLWTEVNKQQVKELLEEQSELSIIDVRTPEEYDSGHIQGAINVNYFSDAFTNRLNEMDKQNTYLVYCQGGGRSSMAAEKMVELGFEFIYHYSGGYADWNQDSSQTP